MTGELTDTYLSELQQTSTDTSQRRLMDFTEANKHTPTSIAVVSKPGDTGILDACDEYIPELGMPERVLTDFHRLRAQMNEYSSVAAHNKAYEKLGLDQKYRNYLEVYEPAQRAVDELVERLARGEDITLVCFEKEPKKCHRFVLREHIETQLQEAEV